MKILGYFIKYFYKVELSILNLIGKDESYRLEKIDDNYIIVQEKKPKSKSRYVKKK